MQFKDFHPITLLIFFASIVILSLITMNPVVLLVLFLGGIITVGVFTKKLGIKLYLPLFFIITLSNPIFSHNGETVLFYLFDQRITFEALFYGFATALLIVGVVFWFKLFSYVFTEDKLTYILGKLSPKLSVVFIMILRFIPLVTENAKTIMNTQKALGVFDTKTIKGKLNLATNSFSSLISLSIENAIDTADVMRSRGFENAKHSDYSDVLYSKHDVLFSHLVCALDAIIIVCLLNSQGKFFYYPSIKFENNGYLLYLSVAILSFLPCLNELKEGIKWKYLISKI